MPTRPRRASRPIPTVSRSSARRRAAAGVGADAKVDQVVVGLHRALARSPAALVVATLEDALRVAWRPNMPGTVAAQRANWSVPLPVVVEDLDGDARCGPLVSQMRR